MNLEFGGIIGGAIGGILFLFIVIISIFILKLKNKKASNKCKQSKGMD